MSLVKNGYEPHPTMLIGTFNEKTMLIDFDKEGEVSDPLTGDWTEIIRVSYDKDDSATIGPGPAYELQSIKNLVDDSSTTILDTSKILLANVPLEDRSFVTNLSGWSDGRLTSNKAWISQSPATVGDIYALDLGTEKYIAGIRTAGRGDGVRQWTTAVDVRTSNTYSLSDGHGDLQLDNASTNYDALTEVDNTFPPVLARYVFIKVRAFGDQTFNFPFPALRCDVLLYDSAMSINNTPTTGVTISQVITKNNRKALFMNYCGVFRYIGSFASGLYDSLGTFGATSVCVFSNTGTRNASWKKLSTHGAHGAFFGVSRYGSQQKLCIQFAGTSYGALVGEYINFPWSDTTTDINYLSWASVKETGTNTYELHLELHSFTDSATDPVLVGSVTFSKNVDLSASSAAIKPYYHSGLDKFDTTTDLNYSSIVVFESRYYVGAVQGYAKTYIINDLISYYRGLDSPEPVATPDLTYTINYSFNDTIDDLSISVGSPVYHFNRMIELPASTSLSKTFANTTPLTRGDNLLMMTIRVKVYSVSDKWHVDGHGSWSLEYHNGSVKVTDGANEVTHVISPLPSTKFNDWVVTINPSYVTFYLNGGFIISKENTCVSPFAAWSQFDINHNANSVNLYDQVTVDLGENWTSEKILEEYRNNRTDFFYHISATASHSLQDTTYTSTISPTYIAEPPSYLTGVSSLVITTPNTTSTEQSAQGSSAIVIPNIANRSLDIVYTLTDRTITETLVTTLYDPSDPDRSISTYAPSITTHEYGYLDKYRVYFELNSVTQGVAESIIEVEWTYNEDTSRLTGGQFTTTVNPITTVGKINHQSISINSYAGSKIQLGYYEFDISNRQYNTITPPSTTIRHIHKTGGSTIVQNNTKSFIRNVYPYIEIRSQQGAYAHERIAREFSIINQGWTDPIDKIVFDVHMKSANFDPLFPTPTKPYTVLDRATITPKAGYATAQRITIEFQVPISGYFAAMATDQITQIIDTDDLYSELISINDTVFRVPIRANHPAFTYVPSLRITESTSQVNYELHTDISVNKNLDNITAFSILVTHPSNLLTMSYNDFGVSTITKTTVSPTQTRFTFSGSHFTTTDELLMQVIVQPETINDDIFSNELLIDVESITLANSSTTFILNSPLNPVFSYNPLSYVHIKNMTQSTKIDFTTEIITGEIWLQSRRTPITYLDFAIIFDGFNPAATIAGSQVYNYAEGWDFTKTTEPTFGLPSDRFVATQLPPISNKSRLLMTFSYRHVREYRLLATNQFTFVNSITPNSQLLAVPDGTIHVPLFDFQRDRELEVTAYSTNTPHEIVVPINLYQDNLNPKTTNQTDSRVTVWYDHTKLNYVSSTTSTGGSLSVNDVTGIYEGLTQGKEHNLSHSEKGGITGLIEARFAIIDSTFIVDNTSIAVRFDSINPPEENQVQIYTTRIDPFPYRANMLLEGTVIEVSEGEAYNMKVDLRKFDTYNMEVRFNVYFNGDKLRTTGVTYGVSDVPGHTVTWISKRRLKQTYSFLVTDSTFATESYEFQVKDTAIREAISDDDWRLVVNEVVERSTLPEGVTFQLLSSINPFSFTPEFQLSTVPRIWFEDEIRVDILIQKDSVGLQSFTIDVFVDDDRTISSTLPQGFAGGIELTNTATITQTLNQNIAGKFTNTNKYRFFFDATSSAYFVNVSNAQVCFFSIKRRTQNLLIKNEDIIVEFTAYETFAETPPAYYALQTLAEEQSMPYIDPIVSISNPTATVLSATLNRLTFTVNTPVLTGGVTVGFTIFYKNQRIDFFGFIKTTISSTNPSDYPIGFENGYEQTQYTATNSFFITHDFEIDSGIQYIDQSMFKIQLTSATSSAGNVSFVRTLYEPASFVNPVGYLIPSAKFQLMELSRLNEKSYVQSIGSTITAVRAGTRNTSRNSLPIVTSGTTTTGPFGIKCAQGSGGPAHFTVPIPSPMYDYVADGNSFLATAIFQINTWDTTSYIQLVTHTPMVSLNVRNNSGTYEAYLRFAGTHYNAINQSVTIQSTGITAIRAMSTRTATNSYTFQIKTWRSTTGITGTFVSDQDKTFTLIATPTTNPTFDPTIFYPQFAGTSYDWDLYYAALTLGNHDNDDMNDTYFMTQFASYVGYGQEIIKMDVRFDDYKTIGHPDYVTRYLSGATPAFTTIGDGSRAEDIPIGDFLSKQLSQTGNQIWGVGTMDIAVFIVFQTSSSDVEGQALFTHGSFDPRRGQIIVNRNQKQNDLSIELNNNVANFQQQHLEKLRYGNIGRSYLYYGRIKQTSTTSSFQSIALSSKLIGLNSSTDSTFDGTHLQYGIQDYNLDPFTLIGWSPTSTYGGLQIGYFRYFKYVSDAHVSYEIERIRRDWTAAS